jgi:hypothetical protein
MRQRFEWKMSLACLKATLDNFCDFRVLEIKISQIAGSLRDQSTNGLNL